MSNLPQDCDSGQLHSIFGGYPDFKEIRHIQQRGVAFIEYDNDQAAAEIKNMIKEQGTIEKVFHPHNVQVIFANK